MTVTRQVRQNNLLPHSNSTWLRRWQLNSPQRSLSQVRQSLRLNLVPLLHIPSCFFDGVSVLGPFVSQKTNPASATRGFCTQPPGSVLLTLWPIPPLAAPEALGCQEEETSATERQEFRRMQTQASSLTAGPCLTLCEEHSSRTTNCPPGLPRLVWKQKLATNLQLRAQ